MSLSNSSFCGWGLLFPLCSEEMEMVNFHPWERIRLRVLKLFVHILCRFTTQTTKSSFSLAFPQVPFSNSEPLLFVSGNSSHSPRPTSQICCTKIRCQPMLQSWDSTKTTPRPSNFSWPIGFSQPGASNTCFSVIVPSDPLPLLRFSAFNCCKYIIHKNCYCKYLFHQLAMALWWSLLAFFFCNHVVALSPGVMHSPATLLNDLLNYTVGVTILSKKSAS